MLAPIAVSCHYAFCWNILSDGLDSWKFRREYAEIVPWNGHERNGIHLASWSWSCSAASFSCSRNSWFSFSQAWRRIAPVSGNCCCKSQLASSQMTIVRFWWEIGGESPGIPMRLSNRLDVMIRISAPLLSRFTWSSRSVPPYNAIGRTQVLCKRLSKRLNT